MRALAVAALLLSACAVDARSACVAPDPPPYDEELQRCVELVNQYRATPDGVVYERFDSQLARRIWQSDRDGGDPKRVTTGELDEQLADVSPDGRQVLFTRSQTADKLEIIDRDGGPSRVIATNLMGDSYFSPDGRRVLFVGLRVNRGKVEIAVRMVNADGTGADSLMQMPSRAQNWGWLGDGSGLIYQDPADSASNVFRLGLDGSPPVQITHVTDGRIEATRSSPDGRRLLLRIRRGRTTNLWVTDVAGGNPRPLTHFDTGTVFRTGWSKDGATIVFTYGIASSDAVLIRASK